MYVGMISTAVTITWGGVTQLLAKGTLLLLVAGGALETAINTANIVNVTSRGPYMGGVLGTDN